MTEINLKFDSKGLIPAVVQDSASGRLLMVAWMNAETLRLTRETGFTHFYSRSRGQVWKKGETSGNTQTVKEIFYDCDADTLLIKVVPAGPACHTGEETCFFNRLDGGDAVSTPEPDDSEAVLSRIYQIIQQRKRELPEGSYVASLFKKGESAILKKIGEESVEFVVGCKNADRKEIVYEAADLWFHSLVAMAQHDIAPEEILAELKRRFK